jgi:hypothetical protein
MLKSFRHEASMDNQRSTLPEIALTAIVATIAWYARMLQFISVDISASSAVHAGCSRSHA